MTYRELITHVAFDDAWAVLRAYYHEPELLRENYLHLYGTLKTLPETNAARNNPIRFSRGYKGKIKVENILYPQEELIDKTIESDELVAKLSEAELLGHILYWSTMYGFMTAKQHAEDFGAWLNGLQQGIHMKYLFLDFDGVLNTERYQAQLRRENKPTSDEYGPLFDPEAVANLRRLLKRTANVDIVITSSWRYLYNCDELNEMWEKRNMPDRIFHILPLQSKCASRGEEIAEFLRSFNDIPCSYIIFDDEDAFSEEQHVNWIRVDPTTGISNDDVERAIKTLEDAEKNIPTPPLFPWLHQSKEEKRRDRAEAKSMTRKRLQFWTDTIADDSPYDYSYCLTILKRKLQYHIGFWRYVQRYVGWEYDVTRMNLCCNLIDIITRETAESQSHVNTRNAERFGFRSFDSETDNTYRLDEFRREKAFQLLWSVLRLNLRYWWD